MIITKENYLKRQHFFRCDEALTTALKAKQSIALQLENFLLAATDAIGIDVEERLQSAVEVALRRHPEALKDILPHIKTHLPPIFLLTAVYTNQVDLVKQIIAYLDPSELHGLSLEVAAAKNNVDVFRCVLPIASDARWEKVLDHVLYHRNEDIFEIIHPVLVQSDIQRVEQLSLSREDWAQRGEWMRAQMQRCRIADEIKCNANPQKLRKI